MGQWSDSVAVLPTGAVETAVTEISKKRIVNCHLQWFKEHKSQNQNMFYSIYALRRIRKTAIEKKLKLRYFIVILNKTALGVNDVGTSTVFFKAN